MLEPTSSSSIAFQHTVLVVLYLSLARQDTSYTLIPTSLIVQDCNDGTVLEIQRITRCLRTASLPRPHHQACRSKRLQIPYTSQTSIEVGTIHTTEKPNARPVCSRAIDSRDRLRTRKIEIHSGSIQTYKGTQMLSRCSESSNRAYAIPLKSWEETGAGRADFVGLNRKICPSPSAVFTPCQP